MLELIILISREMKIFFLLFIAVFPNIAFSATQPTINSDKINAQANSGNNNSDSFTKLLNNLDLNMDGLIDIDEIKIFSEEAFALADKNNDGKISKNEFASYLCNFLCEYKNCECKTDRYFLTNTEFIRDWNNINKDGDEYIIENEFYEFYLDAFSETFEIKTR